MRFTFWPGWVSSFFFFFLPTFLGEGSPITVDYRRRGTLIETSLLEDLGMW